MSAIAKPINHAESLAEARTRRESGRKTNTSKHAAIVKPYGTDWRRLQSEETAAGVAPATISKHLQSFQHFHKLAHDGERDQDLSNEITKYSRAADEHTMDTGNSSNKKYKLYTEEQVHGWHSLALAKAINAKGKSRRDSAMRELLLFYCALIGGATRRRGGYAKPNYVDMNEWKLHIHFAKESDAHGYQVISVNDTDRYNPYQFTEEEMKGTREVLETYFKETGQECVYIGNTEGSIANTMVKNITQRSTTLGEMRKNTCTQLRYQRPGTYHLYAKEYGHSTQTHINFYILREAWRESQSPEPVRETTPPPPSPRDSTPGTVDTLPPLDLSEGERAKVEAFLQQLRGGERICDPSEDASPEYILP
jgi:hypothetical protein